jgi:hypothetical protein
VGGKLSGRPGEVREDGVGCASFIPVSTTSVRLEEPSWRGGGASWNQNAEGPIIGGIGAPSGAEELDVAGGGFALIFIVTGSGAA